ncbi:interferon-induced protein 44-like [Actinia tenebrosa]|uniref:Interferon-induced protein 44-like n=1 Tax=Actinia tenebrosa TaxID=6105 RepID=A0A6P8J4V5_ACTTE|nr:interferon-induced protein 44-like [Actinia tenebrosa]
MGNWLWNSPPQPQQPQQVLTDTPWRKTKEWSPEVKRELRDHISSLAPQTRGQLDVPFFNIALTGQIGGGKSSFFNSVNSIYHERIISGKSEVGITATSLTKDFRVYEINPHPDQPDSNPLPWRICDTPGLNYSLDTDCDVTNILKTVDGHVPDRFKFPSQEVLQDDLGLKKPELKDRAHCVAVVIDGSTFDQMEENMKRKLKNLRKGLITRNIPTYILITHIDEACVEVSKDVSKVYRSIAIRDLVHKIGRLLHGLPENQIFPIMNYKKQVDLEDDIDILLLYALRQMLYSAQGHLENKM